MLISAQENLLHSNIKARWQRLDDWMNDSHWQGEQDAKDLANLKGTLRVFQEHWKEVDKGFMTDPAKLQGACMDMDTAETHAVDFGFTKPVASDSWMANFLDMTGSGPGAGYGTCPSAMQTMEQAHPILAPAAEAIAEYVLETPWLNKMTSPAEKSLLKRIGIEKDPGYPGSPGLFDPWQIYGLLGLGGLGLLAAAYFAWQQKSVIIALAVPGAGPAMAALGALKPQVANALTVHGAGRHR